MRAHASCVVALALGLWQAPARAQDVQLDFAGSRPAPIDVGAFPARPRDATPDTEAWPAPPIEIHGFLSVWATPWIEPIPGIETRDLVRLRSAIVRVDARLAPEVRVMVRLGFTGVVNPLFDFVGTWEPTSELALSVGQLRIPFGASATTPANQLVFPERPRHVQAMLKSNYRDVGVLVHSGARGLFDGLLHYRAGLFDGGGRLGVGQVRAASEPERVLVVARVLLDLGRLLFEGARDRLVLASSYARSRDPAIDTGEPLGDRVLADSILGRRLAPHAHERETQLLGLDLTLVVDGFWMQLEWMYLDSIALDGAAHVSAHGASLELAYTPPWHPWGQAAVRFSLRGEYFDPSLAEPGRQTGVALAGIDLDATHGVRVGVFGGATIFRDAARDAEAAAGELSVRAQYGF